MATNKRYDALQNLAKWLVIKKNFPHLVSGFVKHTFDTVEGAENCNDGADLLGKYSITTDQLSVYLNDIGMMDAVDAVLDASTNTPIVKKVLQVKGVNLDALKRKNIAQARRLATETFLSLNMDSRFLTLHKMQANGNKRVGPMIASMLGLGEDFDKSCAFSSIRSGIDDSAFKKRNKNINLAAVSNGAKDMIAEMLAKEAVPIMNKREIPFAEDIKQKFADLRRKVKAGLATASVIGTATYAAAFGITMDVNHPLFEGAPEIQVEQLSDESFDKTMGQKLGGWVYDHETSNFYKAHKNLTEIDTTGPLPHEFVKEFAEVDWKIKDITETEQVILATIESIIEEESQGMILDSYVVQSGDTLLSIADKALHELYSDYVSVLTDQEFINLQYEIVEQLAEQNNISNPDFILTGDLLEFPKEIRQQMLEMSLDDRVDVLADKIDRSDSVEVAHHRKMKF
ncbi:TPA: LysM domain-containing protein [Vibrio vulnificus]|uniref:LysM domain-containing protein n=1 Tax=Vibrio vulnificus TaxID=672 RepID=A0A8H9K6J8_VIBVL|nr:LysM peptidoglycan-binding domain-containing protein [Vibrio vulnificus]HAS8538383.1 LysM domain-containing protein [Vibrio vulnificus]